VQIYRWNGTSWVFVAPEAMLFADVGLNGMGGKCTAHDVTGRDYKIINTSGILVGFYTPLRFVELGVEDRQT